MTEKDRGREDQNQKAGDQPSDEAQIETVSFLHIEPIQKENLVEDERLVVSWGKMRYDRVGPVGFGRCTVRLLEINMRVFENVMRRNR
ncbi:hypothetical protein [Kyrpidia tusciae]|uniref:hypothetical protein n=1 Tax=Kyrpidia tusciae TaxID=33943 RepID=UPI00145DBA26|nr:hypothetical protein [Kyrpidia tusciae]